MKPKLLCAWKGFLRMLTGSFVALLFGLSGFEFYLISHKSGYEAAASCLIAIALFICGSFAMYALGGGHKQAPTGKFSK